MMMMMMIMVMMMMYNSSFCTYSAAALHTVSPMWLTGCEKPIITLLVLKGLARARAQRERGGCRRTEGERERVRTNKRRAGEEKT